LTINIKKSKKAFKNWRKNFMNTTIKTLLSAAFLFLVMAAPVVLACSTGCTL